MSCVIMDDDWTEGLEKSPVYSNPRSVINHKSSKYITKNIPGPDIDVEEFHDTILGCECKQISCASIKDCSCILRYGKTFNEKGHLSMQMLKNSYIKPVFECNRNCLCSSDCINRVVQHGVKLKLEIYESPTKGLCLRTLEQIRCGHFVCQYAGEIISYIEAKKRILKQTSDSMNYILVVTEHCASGPVMTVVDPTHYGNIGRYINHSCTPNLSLLPVRIDITTPVIALFANRDIEPYEELSFDYGSSDLLESPRSEGECKSPDKNMKKCHCQSEQCKGFLPFHADLFQA